MDKPTKGQELTCLISGTLHRAKYIGESVLNKFHFLRLKDGEMIRVNQQNFWASPKEK